jgi:hypothetical protein
MGVTRRFERFDTGVDSDSKASSETQSRYATNSELVERQMALIAPLLPCTNTALLKSLSALLLAGLGNRKVPC